MKKTTLLKVPLDHKWCAMGPEEEECKAVAVARRPDGISEEDWSNCGEVIRDLIRCHQAARSTLMRSVEDFLITVRRKFKNS
jgi:hypothetical protein